MKQQTVDSRSLWAWVGAALFAPLAQSMGSAPWPWALALALGAGALFLCAEAVTGRGWRCGKPVAGMELLFLLTAASAAANHVGLCWETARAGWIFPVVLLALAALSAECGHGSASQCGALLFWFVAIGFIVLAVFSLPDLDVKLLYPGVGTTTGGEVAAVLIPGAALLLPRKKGKNPWARVLAFVVCSGAISLLTAGVLSPFVAARTYSAFFQMVKGVEILGVAERFDALIASIMTISWFCLLSLLLSAAGRMGGILLPGKTRGVVWTAAGIAMLARRWAANIHPIILAGIAAVLWYVLPTALALRGKRAGEK